MIPNRLSAKFLIQNPQAVEPTRLTAIFQRWIQQHSVEGLLIDVADYKHVPHGPGVMLIGHEGDYAIEFSGGMGVKYTRKHALPDDLPAALTLVTRLALQAVQTLAQEDALSGVQYDTSAVHIGFIDRLLYANRPESLAPVQATLQAFGQQLYGEDASIAVVPGDAREVFTVKIAAPQPVSIDELATQLAPIAQS